MPTAGAIIASMVKAVAVTTVAADMRPNTVIMLTATTIVATAGRTVDLTVAKHMADLMVDPTVVESMVDPTAAERLMGAEHTVAAHPTVAADILPADTLAASIGSR